MHCHPAAHLTPLEGRAPGSLAAILLLLVLAGGAGATEPVSATASATPKEVTIGDPIRYVVEVSAAPQTEVFIPVLAGQLGNFTITDFGELPPRTEGERVVTARWYTLTTFETGDHVIPAPVIHYRLPGEGLDEATGNEVLIGVQSMLARDPAANDIRDIAPPEEAPFDWRPYALAGAVLALGISLVAALYFLLNRPRRQLAPPPRPPHEVALTALNGLRRQQLVETGQFDAFYVRLSAIVRLYLEDRFALHAPEMTTEEFLSVAARDARLGAAHRRLLGTFLAEADLVKFARHLPTLRDTDAAYEAARRFVEETRPATEPAREVQHAAA
jgi:hypothetical protein